MQLGRKRTHRATRRNSPRASDITRLEYRPEGAYALDLEIFSISNLRSRFGKRIVRLPHRYTFCMLLCVTRGECTQLVNFKAVKCKAGSMLALRPGQTHRFGDEQGWDGWIVLFRSEFILTPQPVLHSADFKSGGPTQGLPDHLALSEHEQRIVTDAIAQMSEDSDIAAPAAAINALLRQQLYTLLLRLSIVQDGGDSEFDLTSNSTQRFRTFQQLVEINFAKWHCVAQYASPLRCSGKTLTRAALQLAGVTAKAVIASRINLEAKRLLAHSTMSVTHIGERLGFEDPTNFVKFFRRETACTPGEFRRRQREVDSRLGDSHNARIQSRSGKL
jgi:AraC-like DNA-binding protein/mannose-6-phosphate isomerase-like protein (cupin superfamily)